MPEVRDGCFAGKDHPKDVYLKSLFKNLGVGFFQASFTGNTGIVNEDINLANRLLKKADIMCISSPEDKRLDSFNEDEQEEEAPGPPLGPMARLRHSHFESNGLACATALRYLLQGANLSAHLAALRVRPRR